MTRIPAVVVVALLLAPVGAGAQVPTLDRVDSLLTAGAYETARSTLAQWWSARDEFDVPGSDKARALMLRAQLAPDPEQAEPDYLAVILGYPTSAHAPEALLRLGQGLLSTGDATRAAAYLERLVADYPGRPQRLQGLLWLARANNEARRPGAACTAARAGLRDARDPDIAAMFQVEASVSCAIRTTPEAQPVAEASPEPAPETAPAPAAQGGPFSVQTGAFRYRRTADELVERLRDAGFEPRLVAVPDSELLRVRVGRFRAAGEAGRLLTRIRDAGFDAVVVRDADRERQP